MDFFDSLKPPSGGYFFLLSLEQKIQHKYYSMLLLLHPFPDNIDLLTVSDSGHQIGMG